MKKRLLIIEPHSDDGIISAGGFMEKYRSKYEYHFVLVVASETPLRHNALLSRSERLAEFKAYVDHFNGVWHGQSVLSDELPLDMDSRLDIFSRSILVKKIEEIISDVKPDVLMCTGPSFHHDHTAVYESVIAATRPTSLHYPSEFFILENPTYVHSNSLTRFVPDTYVSLSKDQIERKLECFKAFFPSQIREGSNALSVDGIRSWARYRGLEARTDFAEAFQTFTRII